MEAIGKLLILPTQRAMPIKQTPNANTRPNLLKKHVSPMRGLTAEIKHENTTGCHTPYGRDFSV